MYKNMDYRDTYCEPNGANVRYPSGAKESISGWAYIFTQDIAYVRDLLANHVVEVRVRGNWIPFSDYLPTADEMDIDEGDDPINDPDEVVDPNY